MDRAVASWVYLARRDIASAELLVEADPANALLLCQQALEKALKAHVQLATADPPPKTHHLLRLVSLAGLGDDIGEERLSVLETVGPYVTLARYPITAAGDLEALDPRDARGILHRSQEVVEWLLTRLKSTA